MSGRRGHIAFVCGHVTLDVDRLHYSHRCPRCGRPVRMLIPTNERNHP